MPIVELTSQTFEDQLNKEGLLVVDWWAPWCGPCKVFAPIFEQASSRHPDVTFAKINTDEQQEIAASFQISAIPTLMVFRDQVLVFEQSGVLRGEALDDLVAKVKELDMQAVKTELAAREAEHAHALADGAPGGDTHGR